MRVIPAPEFNAKCLQLMEEVARSGEEITKLVPYRHPPGSLFRLHREELTIHGDIVSPVEEAWNADLRLSWTPTA